MLDEEREQSSPERALWAAVLLQVKQDIEDAKANTMEFQQAVSFLVSGGAWTEAREAIAVILDMDPGAITRVGLGWISARRERDAARQNARLLSWGGKDAASP